MKCLAAIPIKEETLRQTMRYILTALSCLTVGAMIIISFYAIAQIGEAKRYRPAASNGSSGSDDAMQQYARTTVAERQRERCERDVQNSTFSMYTWPLIDSFVTILTGVALMATIGVCFCRPAITSSLGTFVSVSASTCYCIFLVAWTIPGYLHLIQYSVPCRLVFLGIWKVCCWFIIGRWILAGIHMTGLAAAIVIRVVLSHIPSEPSPEPSVRRRPMATNRHVANSLTTSDESSV